jgi:O-antigen ligase
MAGSVIAVLSLTRASYLQWIVSAVVFSMLTLSKTDARKVMMRYAAILFVAVAIAASTPAVQQLKVTRTLIERAEQLVTVHETMNTELSANTRVEMFRRITGQLIDSPIRFVVGYGQLGPGNIGESFVSGWGEFINEYNAHNEYLDSLVRGGVVGVFLEVVLMLVVIVKPLTGSVTCPELDFFRAHSAALAGVAVYALFGETLRWQMFGFYFWLYAGMQSAHLYSKASSQRSPAIVSHVPCGRANETYV